MNFEAVIGLEIHVEMKTKTKMFSSSPVSFGLEPNTMVDAFDMAFPGTMPVVNKQAVINAIRMCHALHMNIDDELWFDRKNYFYSDLPKGYQITQHRRPIGTDGYLEIETSFGKKKIGIESLHIEEDTCKQIHSGEYTFLDFNRAGIPLLEIVSTPNLKTGEEAMKYAEKVRSIVSFLNISDGKMEKGSLRCDVNISIKPIGSKKLGTKVEIKNLNSFENIKRAIDFEIKRQSAVLLSGGSIQQETRRFDETTQKTVLMRIKKDSVDYRYFPETNLVPIKLSKEFIQDAISSSYELAESKLQRYKELGLNDYDSALLTSEREISEYYDVLIGNGANAKLAANWLLVDVQAVLNKKNISINDFKVSPNNLSKLISFIENGAISNKQAREVFTKMQESNKDPEKLIKEMDLALLSDEQMLQNIIRQILNDNPKSVIDYKNGKERAIGFLVNQVNKATNGKANPTLINKLIIQEIKETNYSK